ncbi:MAG: hypothetical protein MZV63_27225 [Marinilabiliales bacterium]|nr:hypothetical protein [Marinilabiliales bacterium]
MIVLAFIILAGDLSCRLSLVSGFVDKYIVSYFSGMANRDNLLSCHTGAVRGDRSAAYFIQDILQQDQATCIFTTKSSDFLKGLLDGVKTIMHMKHKWSFMGLDRW